MDAYVQEYVDKAKVLEAKYLESNYISQLNEKVQEARLHENDFFGQFGLFLLWLAAFVALRVLLLKYLVKKSRSFEAEETRITRNPAITGQQLEREAVWKYGFLYDSIVITIMYRYFNLLHVPIFDLSPLFYMLIIHATVVEFIYYWFHRLLHVGWFYQKMHSYHHKSINTEPTTALSFEIAERLCYTFLFALSPVLSEIWLGQNSILTFTLYFLWFDFMNEGGHINYEVLPASFFSSPLKYLIYSPTFHSVHHTKFKKNFSLFMPWTDILFGTAVFADHPNRNLPYSQAALIKTSPEGYKSIAPTDDHKVDFCLLVHAGYTPSVLYSQHLQKIVLPRIIHQHHRYEHRWWYFPFYPLIFLIAFYISVLDRVGIHYEEDFSFTPLKKKEVIPDNLTPEEIEVEKLRHKWEPFKENLIGTTLIVRSFAAQYLFPSFQKLINDRIERAVLDTKKRGIKYVVLGNFNKAEWINHGGTDLVDRLEKIEQLQIAEGKPSLPKTIISHGDTLSAASVFQSALALRKKGYWNKKVFVTGSTSKIGRAVILSLARYGITVKMFTQCPPRFEEIASEAEASPLCKKGCLEMSNSLSDGADCDLWLTGKMIPFGKELLDAIPKNATVVNFSVPDPLNEQLLSTRPDILHLDTGILAFDQEILAPRFTWLLPRGLIYACLCGGIVHSSLGIEEHEVGAVKIETMDMYWEAANSLGFRLPAPTSFFHEITLPPPRYPPWDPLSSL